jgi:trehalose utilization protein
VIAETDVLTWWGHAAHERVSDAVVERVQRRVWNGMGLLVMHSGHNSKIFRRLMGTSCMLRWREAAERERVWTVHPGHPLTAGLTEESFEIPQTEMYGEFFDIPAPDELIFVSWYEGGEVFRSGCTFRRGKGKIFYFAPGHETFPIYHHPQVQRILAGPVRRPVLWTGAKYPCPAPPDPGDPPGRRDPASPEMIGRRFVRLYLKQPWVFLVGLEEVCLKFR